MKKHYEYLMQLDYLRLTDMDGDVLKFKADTAWPGTLHIQNETVVNYSVILGHHDIGSLYNFRVLLRNILEPDGGDAREDFMLRGADGQPQIDVIWDDHTNFATIGIVPEGETVGMFYFSMNPTNALTLLQYMDDVFGEDFEKIELVKPPAEIVPKHEAWVQAWLCPQGTVHVRVVYDKPGKVDEDAIPTLHLTRGDT